MANLLDFGIGTQEDLDFKKTISLNEIPLFDECEGKINIVDISFTTILKFDNKGKKKYCIDEVILFEGEEIGQTIEFLSKEKALEMIEYETDFFNFLKENKLFSDGRYVRRIDNNHRILVFDNEIKDIDEVEV